MRNGRRLTMRNGRMLTRRNGRRLSMRNGRRLSMRNGRRLSMRSYLADAWQDTKETLGWPGQARIAEISKQVRWWLLS